MSDAPKTTDLERIRHSAAHVLATALLKFWPEAQLAAGPPVENGFYYGVELPHRISSADFEKIEAEMKAVVDAHLPFNHSAISRDEAIKLGHAGRRRAVGRVIDAVARQTRRQSNSSFRERYFGAACSDC